MDDFYPAEVRRLASDERLAASDSAGSYLTATRAAAAAAATDAAANADCGAAMTAASVGSGDVRSALPAGRSAAFRAPQPPPSSSGSSSSAEYVDIDVSQPGDNDSDSRHGGAGGDIVRVEEDLDELDIDEPRHYRRQQLQQQHTRQQHQQQQHRDEPATAAAASFGGEQSAILRRDEPTAAVGTDADQFGGSEDEEGWAREDDDAYNDAVLSSRLDAASTSSTDAAPTSSAFSYSTLTSYIPASIATLPSSLSSKASSLSSALPSSLSQLPSSLSHLPSTLSSLPSHLPSLASLSPLPAGTTTASSASPVPAPVVNFKSINSFTYASDVYYMLLLATSSSLLLYHVDPNPPPAAPNSSASIAVKRVSVYHGEALSHLSSACFLTPSVSLLSSPDLLVPSPLSPPGYLGPLLALTSSASSASSSFPSSCVKIYSAFLSKPVHLLRFRSRVLRVVASTATFAVLLDSEIVVYATPQSASVDELRFDMLYSVRCVAGSDYGVCALGPRWIAYASEGLPGSAGGAAASGKAEGEDSPLLVATSTTPKPLPVSGAPSFALPPSASTSSSASSPSAAASLLSSLPSSSDSLSTISRNIASSLYNLGDQGRRSISNYLTPLPAESGSSASSSPAPSLASPASSSAAVSASGGSSAGAVIVRDVLTQRVLCHLKAHSSPIAALAFDPTGTLLVTAGQHGQYIHIYQLMTLPSSSSASSSPSPSLGPSLSSPANSSYPFAPRFLYRLFRGVTHATLRSLSFSSDSNWFACTSLKGTTHIFAINPHGGPINVSTHAPPPMPVPEDRDERDVDGVSDHPLTLNAIHRIRGNFPSSASASPVSSSFVHLALPSSASHIDHLALLTSTAEVLLYRLSTVYRPPPPTASNSLALLSSAQQHRRRKETVVGESDSIGQMMGGVVEGVGVVMGHVVSELGKQLKNYQSGGSAATLANDPSTAAQEEASQRKLDLVVTAVAHIHLAADTTDTDSLQSGGRRNRDSDGGGGSGGSGGRDRRVTATPNFFRDIEQQRHTHLSRSAGQSSNTTSSASPPSHSTSATSAWLANVELRPYSTPDLPLWVSPQFTLYTYAAPSTSPTSRTAASAPPAFSASPSTGTGTGTVALSWYAEPAVSELQYDKYAGLSSVRVFDGSSLGYTEVKLEEAQVEWSDAQRHPQQPQPQPQLQPAHYQPSHQRYQQPDQHSQHGAAEAMQRGSGGGGAQSSAPRASSTASRVGSAAAGKHADEHKAAGAAAEYRDGDGDGHGDGDGDSGVSSLLARRVNRYAVNGVTMSGYSPPLSAISHRSLSPSVSSDRDSEEQMVM